jgi:hypothetical protein
VHAAAKQYFSISTVVVFKNGKEIKRVEGGDETQMKSVIDTLSA